MPRPLRIHIPCAFYHVTLRGNHRQNIFFSPGDRRLLDDIVAEVIERFEARLHAFCYMTNHIHLLVQVGDVPLGRLMLRIAGRYARIVQARLHTTGHLFEKRYYPILIDADAYLLAVVRYIHLNPVRARMVEDPSDYPWSSHRTYLGTCSQRWITTDLALGMFHPQRSLAIAAYRRFINDALGTETHSPLTERNENDRRILGSDHFAAKLLGESWRPRAHKSLDELIADACRTFAITQDALLSSSSQRHLTKARAWLAHQAITLRVASLSQVARLFGRNEASLRESVKRHFDYP